MERLKQENVFSIYDFNLWFISTRIKNNEEEDDEEEKNPDIMQHGNGCYSASRGIIILCVVLLDWVNRSRLKPFLVF